MRIAHYVGPDVISPLLFSASESDCETIFNTVGMYKHKNIERLITKAHAEAAEAANKVYARYQPEVLRLIQAQLHADDVLTVAMGSACINRKGKRIDQWDFVNPISDTQYPREKEWIGFSLPSEITKTTTND